jgi:putative Mg2+ transporter-C (MgtC) family protein
MDTWAWLASDAGKLVVAVLLGGAIGLERELVDKPAGLRTNILIAVGSTLITIMSLRFATLNGGSGDPARVAAQIVTGVGFLGAGSILQSHASVIGLTTAATIWSVAGIGIAIGAGYVPIAMTATLIILLCLTLLRPLEGWTVRRRERVLLNLVLDRASAASEVLRELARAGANVEYSAAKKTGSAIEMEIACAAKPRHAEELVTSLLAVEGVSSVLTQK